MNTIALTLALVSLATAQDNAPVTLRVVGIHALNTGQPGKKFERGVQEVRSALTDLKFDTYRLLKAQTVSAAMGKEARVPINTKYTVYVTPLSKSAGGRVKITVRASMAGKGKQVNILTTRVDAAPGKPFKLRGLKMAEGEAVIVITLKK